MCNIFLVTVAVSIVYFQTLLIFNVKEQSNFSYAKESCGASDIGHA